jgi:GDPmannose 4,6-dehydratase
LIWTFRPDELYNLAGLSSVRRSFDDPTRTWRSNADAVHGYLEAVRSESPETRFYQSSSTDMFGSAPGEDDHP